MEGFGGEVNSFLYLWTGMGLKKVVLPSVKECMKNGGKIGMASIESSEMRNLLCCHQSLSILGSVGGSNWSGSPCIICHTRVGRPTTMPLLPPVQVSYCCTTQLSLNFDDFLAKSILSRSNVSSWLCYPHRFSRSGEIDFLQGFHVKMFRNIRKKPCQNLLLSTSWILIQ